MVKIKILVLLLAVVLFSAWGCQEKNTEDVVVINIGEIDTQDSEILPLLGVISGPILPHMSEAPDLTEHYQDIGVNSVRNNAYLDDRLDIEQIFDCQGNTYPSWEGCDAENEENYYWRGSDELFQKIISGGFEPFLRLGGEIYNEEEEHDFKGPQNEIQEDNWIIAAKKMVERYGDHVEYLNIWTEWPTPDFWDRSDDEFIAFWTKAYQALKAEYPELKIGGPGFVAGTSFQVAEGEAGSAKRFLKHLYINQVVPDWIGWHLFSNDPYFYQDVAQAYRDLLRGEGMYSDVPWAGTGFFDDVEVIVDAYGFSSSEKVDGELVWLSAENRDELYNGEQGAAVLTACWIALQEADITRAYYYRGNDVESDPEGISAAGGPGLFYGNPEGTYKPTAHAFALWAKMANEYPVMLSTQISEQGLWVLTGENDDGEIALLISNPGEENIDYEVSGKITKEFNGSISAGTVQMVLLEYN